MKLTRKRKAFLAAYTDKLNAETYGNATKSAIKAGYKPSNASSEGSKLLKIPQVSKEIERIDEEYRQKYSKTKDEAILETRKNYEQATDPRMRKFWYELWIDLQGWNVKKTESKVESNTELNADQIRTIANEIIKEKGLHEAEQYANS